MRNIAILASGSGSNAQAIVEYFRSKKLEPVKLILTNNPNAFVLERAKALNIPSFLFSKEQFQSNFVIDLLAENKIDFIVLAGFLWLIPENLIKKFSGQIINIHPALLPKYGGKGMYGMKVHEAVVKNKETETGITIHYVNEIYDSGEVIFQAKCTVTQSDTAESVAEKIRALEYMHFPRVIETLIQ